MDDALTTVRVDKWLWAVRLFKTRSLAAQACQANKVKRGMISLKASSKIQIGDHLEVPTHDGLYKRHIEVTGLYDKRVGAPIAQAAYLDHTSEDTLKEAQEKRSEQRLNRQLRKQGDQGRMTKKQLRDWRKGLQSYKREHEG
ncbi:RNA-binding S4 domain-containing protein [Rubritalea marina]|uniref:RNA-binding S4 domain-containing protein n=1 Tax=Rubritalea marina TaxID=361055 RepID=UPI00047668DE|nr:hypothetical protein [Rubritalea marina]